ncbi:two-component regulator propeller domain-containing protein, partial [Bacteroides reticulotermitis]
MKNILSFLFNFQRLCLLLISLLLCTPLRADDVISNLKFKQLSIFNSLPTDEVQKVYQAKDGFMWFATRYGFCQYDGYRTTLYKSNLYSPDLLTNNNVYCLADDNDSNLWIGTQGG